MATRTSTAISSTWVAQQPAYVDTNYASHQLITLQLSSGPVTLGGAYSRYGYVYFPTLAPAGATVTQATLRLYLRAAPTVDTTVNLRPTQQAWAASRVTWNRRPTSDDEIFTSVTVPAGTLAKTAIEIDVTSLVSEAVLGTRDWFGLTLTSSSYIGFYAEDNGAISPSITVEWSDRPDEPDNLAPAGGAVSTPTPTLTWDFADYGGDRTLSKVRVQIATNPAMTSPVYDSGEQTRTVPSWTPTGFAATEGTTYYWRARHADGKGLWSSSWSDVVEFSYVPLPTIAVTGFTSGVFGDPTPLILADMPGLTAYSIDVLQGKRVHFSGLLEDDSSDDTIRYQVPSGVIRYDDRPYTFIIRAWDGVDRVPVPGARDHARVEWTATYDDDLAVVGVSWQSAEAMSPRPGVLVRWGSASPADRFTIWRADEGPDMLTPSRARLIATVDPEDVMDDDGDDFAYLDQSVGSGAYTYLVARVENGQSSVRRFSTPVYSEVFGRWLIAEDGEMLSMAEPLGTQEVEVGLALRERSEEVELADGRIAVVTTGLRGYDGVFAGVIGDADDGYGVQSLEEARALFLRIRSEGRARYCAGTLNLPVLTSGFNITDQHPAELRMAAVSGRVIQSGEEDRYGLLGGWG